MYICAIINLNFINMKNLMKNFYEKTSLWIHFIVWTIFYGTIVFSFVMLLSIFASADKQKFFEIFKYEYIVLGSFVLGILCGWLMTYTVMLERKGKIFRKEIEKIYVIFRKTTDLDVLKELYEIKTISLGKTINSSYQSKELNNLRTMIATKYNTIKQIKEQDSNYVI